MKNQKRIRDYGISIGEFKTGEKNSITDIEGVKVGQCTIDNDRAKTGVTAIIPSQENVFKNKLFAACHVINGFGKSMGMIQMEELGTIETPIILTNTLSVGIAADALISYMLEQNDDIGLITGTVNPVVCECNDGHLNHIREGFVKKEHIFKAIQDADIEFEEGDVGAGKGMCCFGLKGGIGTSSRILELDKKEYKIGALVLSNFGGLKDLIVNGIPAGKIITMNNRKEEAKHEESGSIITIIATDIPLTERQLRRVAKRASVGINRTGGFIGSGSGEIAIAFSTGNKIKHYKDNDIVDIKMVHEENINDIFRATAESVEEAILNSLICSKTTIGRDGNTAFSLSKYMENIRNRNGKSCMD